MKKIFFSTSFLLFSLASTQAAAFGGFLNSSKTLRHGEYDLSGYSQFYSSDRSGALLSSSLDVAFMENTNLRFSAGVGTYDFALGTGLKWVPLKGKDKLFNAGAVFSSEFSRDDGVNSFLFRTSPFISKGFTWQHGSFEPYVVLPFGFVTFNSESEAMSQFITGTNIKFDSLSYMSFSVEGGFKIKNSESYFALMATVQLSK